MSIRAVVSCLLLPLVWASPVHAVVFCANNSTDFETVLDLAENNGQADEIRLRVNTTYTRNNPSGFLVNPADNRDLVISGGWNAGCNQRIEGNRTIIDGQFARPGMQILSVGGAGQFELRIEYLDFFNAASADGRPALSVTSNPGNTDNRIDLLVQNNRFFLNGNAQTGVSGLATQVNGNVLVRGNLFFANTSVVAVAQLRCETGTASISHNTFVNNTAQGVGGTLQIPGDCVHEIDNNLFWGNTQPDFRSASSGQIYRLRNNNFDQRAGQAQPQLEVGTRFVDPLFAPNLLESRLLDGSPMIDAGFSNPPAGLPPLSLDELPRLTGPAPDIGALEFDQILRDGFE